MLSEFNYHMRAMGCDVDMTFVAHTATESDAYFIKASEIVDFYEKTFSRFDESSELSRINREKSLEMSQDFLDVYAIAQELHEKTHGQFNPLVQVAQIGYDKPFDKMQGAEFEAQRHAQYSADLKEVMLKSSVLTLGSTQMLDFAGFLKGYVARKIAYEIDSPNGLIINIGGDIYVRGKNHNNEPFTIEIENPISEKDNIFLPIIDKALCTSGTYKRRWSYSGQSKYHIISAETKDNVPSDVISASVINENGALADAYATVAVVLGSARAYEFFSEKNICFVLICEDGKIIKSNNIKTCL